MTNKQALREAAQEEIMLRSVSDTSDAWQDLASPEAVLALLDELEPMALAHLNLNLLCDVYRSAYEESRHDGLVNWEAAASLAEENAELKRKLEAAEKRLSEITAPNMLLPVIDNLDENQLRQVIKTCTENYSFLHSKWEAAEKRIAELERGSKVIKCWSCQKSVTVDQVKAEDGYCPLCDCGIDLEEYEIEELVAAGIITRIEG